MPPSQVALPILEAELQKIAIPDFSDNVDTPVGHVTLSLTSITLQSLTVIPPLHSLPSCNLPHPGIVARSA